MKYSFFAFGHKNITGKHKTTLEFTKDEHMSRKGDCIIGIKCDFDTNKIKELILSSKTGKAKISINVNDFSDEVFFDLNMDFCSPNEIVLRVGNFLSERTLGINASKACSFLKKEIILAMKNENSKMYAVIELIE